MSTAILYNMRMETARGPVDEARLDFGAALRYYRSKAGVKQETLAAMLDIPQSRLSRWENQAEPPKDTYVLSKLANALGVSLETLYAGQIPEIEPIAEPSDDPLVALALRLVEKYKGRTTPEEALEVLSGYLNLGDDERQHVRNQIGLLLRIPPRSPKPAAETPDDAGGRD